MDDDEDAARGRPERGDRPAAPRRVGREHPPGLDAPDALAGRGRAAPGSAPCDGDADQPDRAGKPAPVLPRAVAVAPAGGAPAPVGGEFVGCFQNEGPERRSSHRRDLTFEQCKAAAAAAGERHFGLEFPQGSATRGQAFCLVGWEPGSMPEALGSQCFAELDSAGRRLGGEKRLAVYRTAGSRLKVFCLVPLMWSPGKGPKVLEAIENSWGSRCDLLRFFADPKP